MWNHESDCIPRAARNAGRPSLNIRIDQRSVRRSLMLIKSVTAIAA
jgi:hypothetical protein